MPTTASGTRVERVTNEQGRYVLSSLRVGAYVITAQLEGFKRMGYANTDLAIAKTWGGAGTRLEFRWEIFNLFNTANFDLPNRIFGTPNFGRIFSAKGPREIQFGARVSF